MDLANAQLKVFASVFGGYSGRVCRCSMWARELRSVAMVISLLSVATIGDPVAVGFDTPPTGVEAVWNRSNISCRENDFGMIDELKILDAYIPSFPIALNSSHVIW